MNDVVVMEVREAVAHIGNYITNGGEGDWLPTITNEVPSVYA